MTIPGGCKHLNAKEFTKRVNALQSDDELRKIQRYFPFKDGKQPKDDYFIGVKMGELFKLGKEFSDMPVGEIEKLMESRVHEIRAGAMSIMGQCAKGKKCSEERLQDLYKLYIRRHDRINNWDLVDLASYYVVGKYLADKPRDILYKLARSKNMWERRSAILATVPSRQVESMSSCGTAAAAPSLSPARYLSWISAACFSYPMRCASWL